MKTIEAKKLKISSQSNLYVYALMTIGLLSFLIGLYTNPQRTWGSYLLNHSFFMGMGFGAMFFLVVHYLASSGWVVAVRRIPESFASYLIAAFAFTVILFMGLGKIYPWTNHAMMLVDPALQHKAGYFSVPFFMARVVVFFVLMIYFMRKMLSISLVQDVVGGTAGLNQQKKLSAAFLVVFAPLFTVFTVDLFKSLDPKWFSTIFGVYVFIGFVQASIAMMIIVIRFLQNSAYMELVTEDHFHDLGKYLFGFSIFWAYIGVSQYLLIWYANLPEETSFYLARQQGSWLGMSIALPILRFALPFLLLLPRGAKRCRNYLSMVSVVVLVGAWVDLSWIILPSFLPHGFSFAWQDIGLFLGFLGFFLFFIRSYFSRNSLVPVKDPYLHETLHHHVF